MSRSKTLKLFLIDGEPSGRIKCSLANWTGIAYKIPRTSLDKCKDMDILKQSGVYFLFGTDKEDNAVVYIGQNQKKWEGIIASCSGGPPINRLLDRDDNVYYFK